MTTENRSIVRKIWDGPFYIGPLSRPVSVGDVLLKALETLWRTLLSLVAIAVVLVAGVVAWLEVIQPMVFPPLEKQIDVEVSYDDGSVREPPIVGPSDQQPFHCSPDFPLKIAFFNRSQKPISKIRFSVEGRAVNRSTNVVEYGSWRESDTIIPAGYTWKSCWAVSVEEGYDAKTLNYKIEIFGVTEASANTEYRPIPSKIPVDKSKSARVPESPSPKINPKTQTVLATLVDSDWDKIGMGCSCSFSEGASEKAKLIAGGDGFAFFRTNKNEHFCPAPDFETINEGSVKFGCGSAQVQVTPTGESEPGFDGHSVPARLEISEGTDKVRISGKWGCYC